MTFTDVQQGARRRQGKQGDHAGSRGRGILGRSRRGHVHQDVVLVNNLDDRRLIGGFEHVTQDVPDHRSRGVNGDTAVHDNVRAGQQQVAGKGHIRLGGGQTNAARKSGRGQGARAAHEGQANKGTKTHGVPLYLSTSTARKLASRGGNRIHLNGTGTRLQAHLLGQRVRTTDEGFDDLVLGNSLDDLAADEDLALAVT